MDDVMELQIMGKPITVAQVEILKMCLDPYRKKIITMQNAVANQHPGHEVLEFLAEELVRIDELLSILANA